jgi:hypothetical protein
MTDTKRKEILEKAIECVTGQRTQDYGTPENNFQKIADLWSVYSGTTVTAKDVCIMMILLKIARIQNGGGSGDSYVDLAGYAACAGEIDEAEKEEEIIQKAFEHLGGERRD